jgi:methylase of polypeptide subunit release factors
LVLKKHFPEADVSSIDFSEKALETAKEMRNIISYPSILFMPIIFILN